MSDQRPTGSTPNSPHQEGSLDELLDAEQRQWEAYQPPHPPPNVGFIERLRRHSFSIVLTVAIVGFGALLYFAPGPGSPVETAGPDPQNAASGRASQSRNAGGLGTGYATLTVNSAPSEASVVIEGDTVGTTPLEGHRLRSGIYIVSVAKADYFARDTVMVLRDDQSVVYTPRLDARDAASQPATARRPGPSRTAQNRPRSSPDASSTPPSAANDTSSDQPVGTLVLQTTPESTRVTLNGTEVGTTPLALDSVPVGSFEVAFSRSGYVPVSRQIDVRAGQETTLTVSLEARTGRLRVLVRPWGSISIDGEVRAQDMDVWYDTELTAGRYRVSARHPALGAQTRTIRVMPGATESVVFDLREN